MTEHALAFNSLALNPDMLANLAALGFEHMTAIQAYSLPHILQGQDVIAQAKTGSGKTVAFGLGVLQQLDPKQLTPQSLILCPTRELADQVAQELRRLARAIGNIKVLVLGGGVAMSPQVESLSHGAHIVVGTAGRIQKHIDKGSLSLAAITCLVLDEADRMLDMGFYDSISAIVNQLPKQRQSLMFSATYPDGIKKLAKQFMNSPQQITVPDQQVSSQIEQRCYEISPEQRFDAVVKVLQHYRPEACVAFCFTKLQCAQLTAHLLAQGISAHSLNGDLEQRERDQVMTLFANKSIAVLVATDVAARGLDVAGLDLVINVELSAEPETHIHRIGRTGRAGATGVAVSLLAAREARRAMAVEQLQGQALPMYPLSELKGSNAPLPAAMMTLQLSAGRKDKIRAGDILGALTNENGLPASKIGKITINDTQAYVAVARANAKQALRCLSNGKIKGRSIKVKLLE